MISDGYADWKGYEFADHLLNVLSETPLKYQMEYMDGELEEFETGVEEGYINL